MSYFIEHCTSSEDVLQDVSEHKQSRAFKDGQDIVENEPYARADLERFRNGYAAFFTTLHTTRSLFCLISNCPVYWRSFWAQTS